MARVVTPEDVAAVIVDEEYLYPRGNIAVICVLTLKGGKKQVTGVAYGQVFDAETGRREARKKAESEVWPLLVYHLSLEQ